MRLMSVPVGAVLPTQSDPASSSMPSDPYIADSRPTKRTKISANNITDVEPTPGTSTAPKKSRQNRKQYRVREEKIIRDGYHTSNTTTQKHLSKANPIRTSLETATLPISHGAYTALNKPSPPKIDTTLSVQELQALGFQYIAIDPTKQ